MTLLNALIEIEKTCILDALRYFNISDYVTNWVDLLYTNFTVKIQHNGKFTNKIDIQRSVHQGGACSAELFLVCAETLAILIRRNKKIKGITINGIKNLLDQFADDLDICSLYEQESMSEILHCFQKFHHNSGFLLSYEKTSIYRIGSLRNTNSQLYTKDIKWTNNPINVLGVYIDNNEETCVRLNYENTLEKVKSILNSWKNRQLSLMGKINVINTLVASQLIYKMTVLSNIPDTIIKNIYNEITRFIWNGRRSKISISDLQSNKRQGGLNLVNIKHREAAIKCTWVQILEEDTKAANLAYNEIDRIITSDVWRANLNIRDIEKCFPHTNMFWRDVLKAWSLINYQKCEEADPWGQIIWYNSHILINNKPIMWNKPYQKGLLWVCQLFQAGEHISADEAQNHFGLNFTQFYGILKAIPERWKNDICNKTKTAELPFYEHCLIKKNLARYVYKTLQNTKDRSYPKAIKWFEQVGINVDDYIKSFARIYKITNVPKYRSFQYRLLHRAIILNTHLKHWKLIENDSCSFCSQERETYDHIFFKCSIIQTFWLQVIDCIEKLTGIKVELNVTNVILNNVCESSYVPDYVCLLGKQYMSRLGYFTVLVFLTSA